MKPAVILTTVLAALQFVVADDFKTIQGKEYKDATVSRVEPDGIVLKTKSGIAKVYFVELPRDVQERFHYDAAAAKASAEASAREQQAITEKNRKFREQVAQLHGSLLHLKGKVLQVLKNGVLVTDAHFRLWEFTPDGEPDPKRTAEKDYVPLDDLVYLEADPNEFVDGDSVDETFACLYGSFSYITSTGIEKKIRALTVNLDHGVEHARPAH